MSPFQKFPLGLLHSLQFAPLYLAHESLVQLVRELAEIQTNMQLANLNSMQNILLSRVPTLQKILNISNNVAFLNWWVVMFYKSIIH